MTDEPKRTIGKQIEKARKKRRMTQKELDAALGYNDRVKHWEGYESKPKYEDLEKLADVLNVSTDYLLGRTPNISDDETTLSLTRQIGLDENCLAILAECSSYKTDQSRIFLDFLNRFINDVIHESIADDILSAATARACQDDESGDTRIEKNGRLSLSAGAARDYLIDKTTKHLAACAEIAVIQAEEHQLDRIKAANTKKQPKQRGRPRKDDKSSK